MKNERRLLNNFKTKHSSGVFDASVARSTVPFISFYCFIGRREKKQTHTNEMGVAFCNLLITSHLENENLLTPCAQSNAPEENK